MSTPAPPDRDALVAAILRATADLAAARVAYAQGVAERHGLAATDVEVLGCSRPRARCPSAASASSRRSRPAPRPG